MNGSQSIAELRRVYLSLTAAVDESEKAFEPAAVAAVAHDRCPTQEELAGILRVTHRICTHLARFIEGVEATYAREPCAIQQLLDDVEPAKSDEDAQIPDPRSEWYDVDDGMPRDLKDTHWKNICRIHPCRPKGESAIGRIPGIYGISTAINNHLYEKNVVKSHLWRETHDLWVRFTYHGGMTASGGLVNRLQYLGESFQERSEEESSRKSLFRRIARIFRRKHERPRTECDSRSGEDVKQLHRIAARALWLADASGEDLGEDAIATWCHVMDDWLKGLDEGKDLAAGERILMSLVAEAPDVTREEVVQRLRRLHQLFDSERLRNRIDTRLHEKPAPGA